MAQNRSTAVMARRVEPPDSLDFFPTPPWGTRALCEHVLHTEVLKGLTVWEPACGEGDMARPLAEYFGYVEASDIFNYGQTAVVDFLDDSGMYGTPSDFDWVITNPPFNCIEAFVDRALKVAGIGVAMLARINLLEGMNRYHHMRKPNQVAVFVERLSVFKGRLDPKGSNATMYAWFVWYVQAEPPETFIPVRHIPPCRAELERWDTDYAHLAPAPAPLLEAAAP